MQVAAPGSSAPYMVRCVMAAFWEPGDISGGESARLNSMDLTVPVQSFFGNPSEDGNISASHVITLPFLSHRMATSPLPEPSPTDLHRYLDTGDDDEDADTASQRSISLSSPPASPRVHHHSALDNLNLIATPHHLDDPRDAFKRESNTSTVDTDFASDADGSSMFRHSLARDDAEVSPSTSVAPSLYGEDKDVTSMVYPPSSRTRGGDDNSSISSLASGSSRKTRPESLLVTLPVGQLILGIALVDFNHLVCHFACLLSNFLMLTVGLEIGPRIEYSKGEITENEEVAKILPFLALPDGAHLVRFLFQFRKYDEYSFNLRVPKIIRIFTSSHPVQIPPPSSAFRA